ncbi:MAG: NUDIX hydrolase [Actinomycetota bacterium]|nr:NUDIX hydrolase [Actinomycetota bacterium]
MRWTVHGETVLYESPWVALHPADVELPDGRRRDHHLVRLPAPAAGVVVIDPGRGVLPLGRHRFITDGWGWEIPAGRVEAGESIPVGAAREVEEETAWRPGPLRPLTAYHPSNGLSDQTFHLFAASGCCRDTFEPRGHGAQTHSLSPLSRTCRSASRPPINRGP